LNSISDIRMTVVKCITMLEIQDSMDFSHIAKVVFMLN